MYLVEEDARGEERGNDGADGLDGLGELEAEFRQSRGPADGDVRVRGRLERGEAGADDEEGAAEAAKGLIDGARPEHECADAINAQADDKGPPVTEATDDPARPGERTDKVGAEVCGLQTAGLACSDVERVLKLCVQNVKESVSETPQLDRQLGWRLEVMREVG